MAEIEVGKNIEMSYTENQVAGEIILNESNESANTEKIKEAAEILEEPMPEIEEMRDYSEEVKKLLEYCPELKGKQIPEEVIADFTSGVNLVQAYREYERKSYIKKYGDNTKASLNEKIQKQNILSALKAPVRGVYGGGAADNSPSDDFLAGFNADKW